MKKLITLLLLVVLGSAVASAGIRFMTKMDDGNHYILTIQDDDSWYLQECSSHQIVERGTAKSEKNPGCDTDVNIDLYSTNGLFIGTGIYHAMTCKFEFAGYVWQQLPN